MANTTVKILHTSDIQLGKGFPRLGKAGDLVRSAIKDTFERTMKVALDDGVDGVIIAGNLFSASLTSRNLIDFTFNQIERLGRIPVILVPGRPDSDDDASTYKHLSLRRLPGNLNILGIGGKNRVEFKQLGFSVQGIASGSSKLQLPSENASSSNIEILVVPSGIRESDSGGKELTQQVQEASASGRFHYIAVGGSEAFSRWSDRVVTSGSPEGVEFVEGEPGRVILAEISREQVDLSHREVGKLKWVDIEFSSENYRFTLEVERELQSHADPQTILRARLTGRPPQDGFIDVPLLRRSFREKFCHLIVDELREFDQNLIENLQESSSNLVNEFTELAKDAYDQAPQELKSSYLLALTTGRALLSGKDVM